MDNPNHVDMSRYHTFQYELHHLPGRRPALLV